MTDFIPYFAGIITLLFGIAFAYAITTTQKKDQEMKRKIEESRSK